ncbi:MAG: transglutaminase domain-containing protein [Muribaculaceae bacterium]|nr:transglutaminase domain-containing protein [Muribaculaceae bacterium]
MPKKLLLPLALIAVATFSGSAQNPAWLETDSASAIKYRLNRDFPYTVDDIKEKLPQISSDKIDEFIAKGYIENMEIDGVTKIHRKAPGNVKLLAPDFTGDWKGRGAGFTEERRRDIERIVALSKGDGTPVDTQRVTYRFSIDVPTHDFLRGDTLTVYMPVPIETPRQSRIRILSASPAEYVISTLTRSDHNTICFRQPVTDDTTHFEYTCQFDVAAQYFSPEYIRENIRPYDKESELYKKYTTMQAPHIVPIDQALIKEIVGDTTDPFECSEKVLTYISDNFPWAGAREYSTIPCMPEYVINGRHGDCGQVTMLYLSIMRSLGIPARWESGWVINPGKENFHDWAEVYFEGVGWVPVDASAGRYPEEFGPENMRNFYSTGFENQRMAANKGICDEFFPPKKFLRSETVDNQAGEVECSKGNIFYPGWTLHFDTLSIEPK